MNHLSIVAALAITATSVHAQVGGSAKPGQVAHPARPSSSRMVLAPSVGTVSGNGFGGDQSGVGLNAKFALPSGLSMVGAFNAYSDAQAYALGLGYSAAVGSDGKLAITAALGVLDINDYVEFGTQMSLRAAYEHNLGSGLTVGVGFSHFFNDEAIGEDVTAPTFTVGYQLGKDLSLEFTYSPDDAILGVDSSENSMQLGVVMSF